MAATEKAKREKTAYHVLRRIEAEKPTFEVVAGRLPANNSEAAIKNYVESHKGGDGTYVAVPARSFDEVVVKVETTTVVKLGGAV